MEEGYWWASTAWAVAYRIYQMEGFTGSIRQFVREVQEWHTPAELDEVTAAQLPEGFSAVMVETGASDAFQIEIVQGLSEGDEVATTAVETNPYGMYY